MTRKKIKFTFVIDEELEKRFRFTAFANFGYKKGAISKALEEALKDYIKKYEREGD